MAKKCKQCGEENGDAKRTCSRCGAFLEGYTLNNVTGEYGYRGADGGWYKSEEEYRAHCSGATHSDAIDTAKVAMRLAMAERAKTITQRAMREKISPIVSQITALIAEAFQVGVDVGMECGRYTDYNTKED
jgi:hypothetical protein